MRELLRNPPTRGQAAAVPPADAVTPACPAPPSEKQAAVQQAVLCLELSGRRLKQAQPGDADEILHFLRAATAHLQEALDR